ncbi:MAG TPA: amine dehydrogenase large subunit [Candidatus Binataceae bacterium]|nr:amine dehydrogenase large subunit [Candidatus Binataceae bacterium]
MTKRAVYIVAIVCGLLTWCGARAQMPPEEGVKVRELPLAGPHWVFIMNPFSGTLQVTSVFVVDGDSLQIMGQMTGGITSAFAVSPDRKQIYMADTFYSRGSRGERTDVLTIYDARHLAPVGEVILPTKRQLSIPDSSQMAVTPDGRFVLVANVTPATSVSVVDMVNRSVAGEIETSGCAETLIAGARRFVSVCSDGAMLTTEFNDDGKVTAQKRTDKPFFDIEKDPVFGVPARVGEDAYFVSYHGMVYPMNFASNPATPGSAWSLFSDAERQAGWLPGGYQPLWGNAAKGLLFVLMHQGGGEWTHKNPGTEVWVYDLKQHKRIDRIVLPQAANSILVSQDNAPTLFALSAMPAMMQSFSALDGRYLGTISGLSGVPWEMFGL